MSREGGGGYYFPEPHFDYHQDPDETINHPHSSLEESSEVRFWPASSQIGLVGTPLSIPAAAPFNAAVSGVPSAAQSIAGAAPSSVLSDSETLTSTVFFEDDLSVLGGHGPSSSAAAAGSARHPTLAYMAHARQQSAAAKRWLQDAQVHIDPYLSKAGGGSFGRRPSGAGLGPFGSRAAPAGNGNPFTREPLLEELLPRTEKLQDFDQSMMMTSPEIDRKDLLWSRLYTGLMGVWLVLGVLLLCLHPSLAADPNGRLIRAGEPFFRVLVESWWVFVGTATVAGLLTAIWTVMLRRNTQNVVYGTLALIPLGMVVTGSAFIREYSHGHGGLVTGSLGLGLWLGVLCYCWFVWVSRHSIRTTIAITKTSAAILGDNPGIYLVSVGLALGFLLFIGIWQRLFLAMLQLPNGWWKAGLVLLYAVVLGWTSAVFASLQKCMIGGVVCRWYFYRHDPAYYGGESSSNNNNPSSSYNPGRGAAASLGVAFNAAFGQVCLAALILTWVRMVRYSLRLYQRITNRIVGIEWLRSLVQSVGLVVGFVERLLEHVTDFALYHVALTGDSFCTSGRAVYKIFRRNLLVGLTTGKLFILIVRWMNFCRFGLGADIYPNFLGNCNRSHPLLLWVRGACLERSKL